jgi:hypothetical protein
LKPFQLRKPLEAVLARSAASKGIPAPGKPGSPPPQGPAGLPQGADPLNAVHAAWPGLGARGHKRYDKP